MSVTTAQDTIAGIDEKYRTCLDTGLKVYTKAETLIKVNAVTAVIFLAVGGFFGVLVALTRWPAVHILPADLFYLVLTAHGAAVLLFWIIFFEMAILYFPQLPPRRAARGVAGLYPDAGRRAACHRGRTAGRIERDVHLLRAHAGGAALLPGAHSLCRRRPSRLFRLFWHPGDRQGGGNL
jgi:hypothetical protein